MMGKGCVSLTAVQRLFKDVGCERVSEEAKALLQEHLDDRCTAVARDAVSLARHARRKTVRREDVELALSQKSS